MVDDEHGIACLVVVCVVDVVVVALVLGFVRPKSSRKPSKQTNSMKAAWAGHRFAGRTPSPGQDWTRWYLPRPSKEDNGIIGMSDSVACTSPRPSHARRICERQIGFLALEGENDERNSPGSIVADQRQAKRTRLDQSKNGTTLTTTIVQWRACLPLSSGPRFYGLIDCPIVVVPTHQGGRSAE
jgi:hypothetical protein